MSTTDNLALTLIETAQAQKEVTANEAFSALDAAICETLTVEVGDGANEPSAADVRGAVRLSLVAGSPGPTGAVTLTLPTVKRLLVVSNECGEDASVECDGGSESVTVADGASALIYCDGTEVYGAAALAGQSEPLAVGGWIAGVPGASEVVFSLYVAIPFELGVDFVGAGAEAGVAATATTDFDVQQDGVSVGTMRFAAAATSGTFIAASSVSFAVGEVMRIVAPATPDATLADISFTFKGVRL